MDFHAVGSALCARRSPAVAVAALLLGAGAVLAVPAADAEAKTPGSKYCFYDTCHRVASIAETEAMIGREMTLNASFYDDCRRDTYNPCGLTSSGEAFHPERPDNAASPIFPDGTTLLLFNPRTRGAAVVRVNNAGPYWGKRKIDVSKAAAEKLGFRKHGVADLQVRVIKAPSKAEATYKKNRRYGRVPGFLGQYGSLPEAHRGMAAVMALEAIASSMLAPLTGGIVAAARDETRVAVAAPAATQLKTGTGGKSRQAKAKSNLAAAASGAAPPQRMASVGVVLGRSAGKTATAGRGGAGGNAARLATLK